MRLCAKIRFEGANLFKENVILHDSFTINVAWYHCFIQSLGEMSQDTSFSRLQTQLVVLKYTSVINEHASP